MGSKKMVGTRLRQTLVSHFVAFGICDSKVRVGMTNGHVFYSVFLYGFWLLVSSICRTTI